MVGAESLPELRALRRHHLGVARGEGVGDVPTPRLGIRVRDGGVHLRDVLGAEGEELTGGTGGAGCRRRRRRRRWRLVGRRRRRTRRGARRRGARRREATDPWGARGGEREGVGYRAPGRAGEARIPEARAGARARGGGMDEGGGGGDPKVLFCAIGSDDSPRAPTGKSSRRESSFSSADEVDCGGRFAAGPRVSQALNPRRASLPSPGSVARCAGRERPRRRIARRVVARGRGRRSRRASRRSRLSPRGGAPDPPTRRAGPTVDSPKRAGVVGVLGPPPPHPPAPSTLSPPRRLLPPPPRREG